ncbi:GtrA family protein [Alkalibacterium kapii]|uniref:Membrane protein n=1 Tax=Alkalibacterium kapii TaxID=426704 RepID=A0A511ATA1_9LACT|nr:GtrA family protein [Alkalibacterium kapii]GEK91420.1 membrane protein [Alkalibacterium kapii]
MKKLYIEHQEKIAYLIVGGLTTLVNFGVFYLLNTVFSFSYLIANAVSILAAILFAFLLNKMYVFKSVTATVKAVVREFILFTGFRLGSGLFDMLSMWVLVGLADLNTSVAKVLTGLIIIIINYVLSKFIVFRKSEPYESE